MKKKRKMKLSHKSHKYKQLKIPRKILQSKNLNLNLSLKSLHPLQLKLHCQVLLSA